MAWVCRRMVAFAVVAIAAALFATVAEARITLVRITPARTGSLVKLTVRVSANPNGQPYPSFCWARVQVKPSLQIETHQVRVPATGAQVSWTWRARNVPGRYKIAVVCTDRLQGSPGLRGDLSSQEVTLARAQRRVPRGRADEPTSRRADEPTSRQADKPTSRQADKPTSRQADKPTSRQADKPTSRQADKPTSLGGPHRSLA